MIIFSQQLANYESLQCPRKLFDLALNIFNSRHGKLDQAKYQALVQCRQVYSTAALLIQGSLLYPDRIFGLEKTSKYATKCY